ncbi:MAG: NADAR family protein [bacterium]|nr:NADAR family protein [bacterium]
MGKENSTHALFYEYEWYIFSNFASFEVRWCGEIWKTSEHAYQATKFEDEEIRNKIKNARSAHDAYKLATVVHKDKVRGYWSLIKLGVMEEIVRAKLSQYYYIQKKLLETGDRIIVEDSHRDDFWGWGAHKDGSNYLGKIWMKLREELRAGKISLLQENYE